jgi:hypothetical protein
VIAGFSLAHHYTLTDFPRAPFQEADAYLKENLGHDEIIVHSNKLSFFPMYVHDRELPAGWVDDPAGDGSDTLALPTREALGLYPAPDIVSAASGAGGIWFVIFNRAISEYGGSHPQVEWLDDHYQLAGVETFGQLQVRHYVLK